MQEAQSLRQNQLSFCFFFSFFQQRADGEALITRLLPTSLILVASPILVKSTFFTFRSSLTLPIQIFFCLPLHLFPSTWPCKAAIGNLSPLSVPNVKTIKVSFS